MVQTVRISWFVMVVGCVSPVRGAEPAKGDPSQLTLDRIFTANEFKEQKVESVRWSKTSAAGFMLTPPRVGKFGKDLMRIDTATGEQSVVATAQQMIPPGSNKPLTVDSFDFNHDETKVLLFVNTKRVWRRNTRGDYWVLDRREHSLQRLGGDAPAATLMFAKFSPDGTRVAYVRQNNVYVQDLASLAVTSLTADGTESLINGTADWVNEEELGIRDGFRWSPDGNAILFWQFNASGVRRFQLINYTDANYPKLTSFPYPKAGEKNSAVRLGVAPATGGAVCWLDIPGDPRQHYLPHADWTDDGRCIVLQQFNRPQTQHRVMVADPATGAVETILTETDAAWVENQNSARWVKDGFVWLSERSGWRHAYRVSMDGKTREPITTGESDVTGIVAVDDKNGWLYYLASPENAGQRYLYRASLQGGGAERLTPTDQPGTHVYDFAPDCQWAVHTYSTFATPPVTELIHLPDHRVVVKLEENRELQERLARLTLPTSEFFRVDIEAGVTLDGWRITPPNFDPTRRHPLLLHVYGEPAGQTVRDAWSGQRLLWHWLLAQQGYVIASVDNRGTPAPRGREWRKSVHRQIGVQAPEDQAAAVRALLRSWPFVDPDRVGIWGWSGGGSMSLHAIFRHPNLYRTAIAIAPVPDQRLYDSIYQERYMGTPQDNPDGYRAGSPITYAKSLAGHLLLVHGTGDDNVHYQGTEKLINELVAQHKQFELMSYPNRSHAITEGKGTTRHLYGLMTDYLRRNLPP